MEKKTIHDPKGVTKIKVGACMHSSSIRFLPTFPPESFSLWGKGDSSLRLVHTYEKEGALKIEGYY